MRDQRQGLRHTVLSKVRSVELRSEAGLYLGDETQYSLSLSRLTSVSERITRGLYFHHHGARLPATYSVASRPASAFGQRDAASRSKILELIAMADPEVFSIGSGVFQYRFGHVPDDPGSACWIFLFYETIPYISFTTPIREPDLPDEHASHESP